MVTTNWEREIVDLTPKHHSNQSDPLARGEGFILVVDDEMSIRRLEQILLEEEGYSTVLASSGEEALEILEGSNPALVMLDIGLPGIDGFTTCQRIRDFSQVPIVMVTGRKVSDDVLLGLEVGADDYITKPFAPADLTARVSAVLRRSETCSNGKESDRHPEELAGSSSPSLSRALNNDRQSDAQAVDDRVYEGDVRLAVETSGSIRQLVDFVSEVRQNPQFRLLRLVANKHEERMDIWIGLREPLFLKKTLLGTAGVSQVYLLSSPNPENTPEQLLRVCLTNYGTGTSTPL